jgi:hypothetical protein
VGRPTHTPGFLTQSGTSQTGAGFAGSQRADRAVPVFFEGARFLPAIEREMPETDVTIPPSALL